MIGGEEKTEVKPVFCDDEANNFPTSLKFIKQSNEVFDHILSVLKAFAWFDGDIPHVPNVQGRLRFSLDGKEEMITFETFDGNITDMNNMSRLGESCFFYDKAKKKVGVKGTLRINQVMARYKQTIEVLSTKREYEGVTAVVDHLDYSFKAWPNLKATPVLRCKLRVADCNIEVKLKEMKVADISFGPIGENFGDKVKEVLKQNDIDIKSEARKEIREILRWEFKDPYSEGITEWIQYWFSRALAVKEEWFFFE